MRLFLTGRQFLRQIKRLAEARHSERRAACTTRCAASVSPPLFSRVWHTAFPGCALPCSSYPGQQGRARHSPAQLSPTSTWADPPAHFLRTRGRAGSAEGPTAPPHPAFTGARRAKGLRGRGAPAAGQRAEAAPGAHPRKKRGGSPGAAHAPLPGPQTVGKAEFSAPPSAAAAAMPGTRHPPPKLPPPPPPRPGCAQRVPSAPRPGIGPNSG